MCDVVVDVVVKFGGSLERRADFPNICKGIGRSFQDKKAVIIPGGGRFADIVRASDERWGLDASTSHLMALLAMDQFGCLLAEKIPGAVAVRTVKDIVRARAEGLLPVFLPSAWLRRQKSVPESWDLTSDSISCVFAIRMKASSLVLLKDRLPGEGRPEGMHQGISAQEASRNGWVDPLFASYLSSWRGKAWLCDGTQQPDGEKQISCERSRCLRLR
jgi:aspartokinase-like uncharacterized kinase